MARMMYAIFSTSSLAPFLRNERAERMGGEKRLLFPRKNSGFQLAGEEERNSPGEGE
jgi:hypothetical protein